MTFDEFKAKNYIDLGILEGWVEFDSGVLKKGALLFHNTLGYLWYSGSFLSKMNAYDKDGKCYGLAPGDIRDILLPETESLPEATPQTQHGCTLCGTSGAYQGFTREECLNEECDFYSEAWRKSCSPCATQEEEPVSTTKTDTTVPEDWTATRLRIAEVPVPTLARTEGVLGRLPGMVGSTTGQWPPDRVWTIPSKSAGNLSPQEYLLPPKETSDDSSPSRSLSDPVPLKSGVALKIEYDYAIEKMFREHYEYIEKNYLTPLLYVRDLQFSYPLSFGGPPEEFVPDLVFSCTPSQGQPSTHRDCIRPPAPEAPAETSAPLQLLESPTTIQLCLFCARHACKDMQCVR